MPKVGMAVVKVLDAYSVTASGATNIDITDAMKKGNWTCAPVVCASLDEVSGAVTCDCKVQISLNGGTTYTDAVTFTQASADAVEQKAFTIPPFGDKVRVVVTLGGGSAEWKVTMYMAGPSWGSSGS